MTARDRFTVDLLCPVCGLTGVAHLSEADGYAYLRGERKTSVDHLPDGFKVVQEAGRNSSSIQIYCAAHNVLAEK